jgi:hypothetical protein
MKKHHFLILFFIILLSCKSTVSSDNSSNSTKKDEFLNGSYCAKVDYYNSRTNFTNSYTLNIEVEDNKLVKINFPKGGWLDETHFTPPSFDDQGRASFSTIEGLKYEIKVIENRTLCALSTSNPIQDEEKIKIQTYTTINKYVVLIAEGSYSQTSYYEMPDYMSQINLNDDPPMKTEQFNGVYPINSAMLRGIALSINQYDGTLSASSAALLNQYLINYEFQVSQETLSSNSDDMNKSFPKVSINKSYYKLFDDEAEAKKFVSKYYWESLKNKLD